MTCSRLLFGIVVESKTNSWTGEYLYSDYAVTDGTIVKNSALNTLTRIPLIGIIGGIIRISLGIIHSIGHLLAALFTGDKGHLWHAAKGGCEILRGLIEILPIIGRIFANCYIGCSYDSRCWWMIKMYNPESPDGLDTYMNNWNDWKTSLPLYYEVV